MASLLELFFLRCPGKCSFECPIRVGSGKLAQCHFTRRLQSPLQTLITMSSGHKGREGGNNYYFGGARPENRLAGGRGGSGGKSRNGAGGAGGQGMGASLSLDIQTRNLHLNNNLRIDDRSGSGFETAGIRPIAVDRPYIQQNIHQHGDRGALHSLIRRIDILHRAVALSAIHDSSESYPQPKCHPETRTKMLEDLRRWTLIKKPKPTVLWLYGPAGAGKSAIMQTLARKLQDAGRLGHGTRGNGQAVFSTIAYQLALDIPSLRGVISQVVENDPSIVARSIETQMQKLISEPCSLYRNRDPLVIIIDGLDECNGHDIQENVLRVLRNSCSDHTIPFYFFVASRPEPHIREVFEPPFYSGHHHSVNVEQSFHDVRKYLSDEFARINREHDRMARVPSPWPSENVLAKLVWKSSGHFIYASTIIKFIDDKNHRPTRRLAVVQDANGAGSESAFDPLDQLYMTILNSAPRQSDLTPILCAMVHFDVSLGEIDQLFRFAEGETRLCLRGLHSLLVMPPHDGGRISSHHASFLDFLNNPGRSRTFCVATLQYRIDLARIVLEAYVGRHDNIYGFWLRFLQDQLTPFITSFPPSAEVAELLPLIGTIAPECIFGVFAADVPGQMLAWLKKIPSAPRDLIKLWEDYECMILFERTVRRGHRSAKRIFPCSPEFLRILVSLVVFRPVDLSELRGRLDLTWTEMGTSICSPSSNVASDQHGPPVLAVRLAFRDVALHCIRKMMKTQLDMGGQVYSWETRDAALESIRRTGTSQIGVSVTNEEQYELVDAISYLVRLSPPCLVLYRELWSAPIAPIWYSGASTLIYHVSKWLESFPNPTTELIAFWNQGLGKLNSIPLDVHDLEYAENGWRDVVKRWNWAILRLDLHDTLELPLPDFV
ncbi:hypothetical protein C8R45DRAFT_939635 [Mycena sanguinolenta]|nr:hypothetical protein C8R45DRAFT_939635 [Mycena sanguinolenta]